LRGSIATEAISIFEFLSVILLFAF